MQKKIKELEKQENYLINRLWLKFTEMKNINHREFFELGAIETMIKYGYEAEVKGVLTWKLKQTAPGRI